MRLITIPRHAHCAVVEDSEERLEWFCKKLAICAIAETPQQALELFRLRPVEEFDIVFLDHDCRIDAMGVRTFVDQTDSDFLDSTFWTVAQHLHRTEYSGLVVIHSGNPVGAKRMEALLSPVCKVFVIPFGQFDIEVK